MHTFHYTLLLPLVEHDRDLQMSVDLAQYGWNQVNLKYNYFTVY